jgi:chromosome segregation ATPase
LKLMLHRKAQALEEAEEKMAGLKKRLGDSLKRGETHERRIQQLEAQKSKAEKCSPKKSKLEGEQAEKIRGLEVQLKKASTAQRKAESAEKEAHRLKAELAKVEANAERLESEVAHLKQGGHHHEVQEAAHEQKGKEMKHKMAALKKDLESAEGGRREELSALKSAHELEMAKKEKEAKEAHDAAVQEREGLRRELKEQENDVKAVAQNLEAAKEREVRLETELAAFKEGGDALVEQQDATRANIERLESEILEAKAETDKWQQVREAEAKAGAEERKLMEGKLADAQEELTMVTREHEEQQKQAISAAEDHKGELARVQEAEAATIQEVEIQKKELATLQSEVEELRAAAGKREEDAKAKEAEHQAAVIAHDEVLAAAKLEAAEAAEQAEMDIDRLHKVRDEDAKGARAAVEAAEKAADDAVERIRAREEASAKNGTDAVQASEAAQAQTVKELEEEKRANEAVVHELDAAKSAEAAMKAEVQKMREAMQHAETTRGDYAAAPAAASRSTTLLCAHEVGELEQWLASIHPAFASYAAALSDYGYDDLSFLREAEKEEFEEALTGAGMSKPAHRARVIRQLQQLAGD